jgi:G3E family GTPase
MMRYKGILNIVGTDKRVVFQGVHMLMGAVDGPAWAPGEPRESKIVFIGKNLPKDRFLAGLSACVSNAVL